MRYLPAQAIVLVTAYGREEVMQQAEQAGLDGFLLNPVNASILFDTIMQAFGKQHDILKLSNFGLISLHITGFLVIGIISYI